METDTQIEAHNATSLRNEVADTLARACDLIGLAQDRLDDLGIYRRTEAPRVVVALEDPLGELREIRSRVLEL